MHSIDASILIDAPVDDCYRIWMDFEKFPSFMRRVVSVKRVAAADLLPEEGPLVRNADDPQKDLEGVVITDLLHEVAAHGDRVWRWEIKGPLGQLFEWTAGIVQNEPGKMVSWSTLPEEELPNTGTVNFLKPPTPNTAHPKTLMTITMSFSAPAGIVGEFLSDVVGYGDNLLCEALEDFKSHVEQSHLMHVLENGSEAV